MNHENHVLTPGVGKPTSNYKSGLAEIRDQLVAPDEGPKFRSVLEMDKEASTGHDLSR